jgi:uncharacterized RDD family membrane protein YckC
MQCPNCQREYDEQPLRCACGYDYQTGAVVPSVRESPESSGPDVSAGSTPPPPRQDVYPAKRIKRLGAKVFDGLLAASPLFLMVDSDPEEIVFSMILGVVVILGVQWYMLATMGQTIGKYLLKIKIVKAFDYSNGGFVSNVLIREIANGLLNFIPLYGIVDGLFIFRQDQRCVHDHLASTIVIEAED